MTLKKMKVLIVDEMHPSILEMIAGMGLEPTYLPSITNEEFIELIPNFEGLIIRSKFNIDKSVINIATNLKFIGRAGAGLDLIDVKFCKKKEIEVFAANEGNRIAVAEHLIGMLLSLFNKINLANAEVKNGLWKREKNRGTELYGKTVGIIGYGNNGQATAERLVAFGCNVIAYDKYRYGFGNQFVKECSMEDIFRSADILSLHIPLTEESFGFVNTKFLNNFENSIYLCNVSRGEIVNLEDVVSGLENGKVIGACLDVLENEKINKLTDSQQVTFDKLKNNPDVLLTPHVAGWTHQSYRKINEVLCDKIGRYLLTNQ